MSLAPLRPCSAPRCTARTSSGLCPEHRRAREQARGSAYARGYDHGWARFRVQFIVLLASQGIPAACGASLSTGPNTKQYSACAQANRLNALELHLDHEPPLTLEERKDSSAVCNPNRVGFLCRECHGRKTQQEQVNG
jgi:hypothetical protein